MLLGEHCAYKSPGRGPIGKDSNHTGPAAILLVQALLPERTVERLDEGVVREFPRTAESSFTSTLAATIAGLHQNPSFCFKSNLRTVAFDARPAVIDAEAVGGSPADAGIDRFMPTRPPGTCWFPHASGAEPGGTQLPGHLVTLSPSEWAFCVRRYVTERAAGPVLVWAAPVTSVHTGRSPLLPQLPCSRSRAVLSLLPNRAMMMSAASWWVGGPTPIS